MIVSQKLFEILLSNLCSREKKLNDFLNFYTDTNFLIYIQTLLGGQNAYIFRGFWSVKDIL